MSEQKIARRFNFAKYTYEETTNVVNLHRMALIFFESSRTAALVLGGVTLPPAISSLVNRMLSRAKAVRVLAANNSVKSCFQVFASNPDLLAFLSMACWVAKPCS